MGPSAQDEHSDLTGPGFSRADTVGAWRDDDQLVLERGAALPDRCIVTGEPAAAYVTTTLYWHNPAWYLALFLLPGVYVVYLLMFASSIELTFAISTRIRRRRRASVVAAWTLLATAMVVGWAGVSLKTPSLASIGALLMIAAVVVWIVGTRYIRATRMTSGRAWIRGANQDYLCRLPEWTGLA